MGGDDVVYYFQGPGCAGFRVHFQIWKVWLCKKMKNTNKMGKKTEKIGDG
jgi:hypothetical protein